jgi:hypothetical protein
MFAGRMPALPRWQCQDAHVSFAVRNQLSSVDSRPILDFIESVKLHTVSELKASAGRILDEAIKGHPQYIFRRGQVAVIFKADLISGVEQPPDGFFKEAYANPDPERLRFERSMAKVKQKLER